MNRKTADKSFISKMVKKIGSAIGVYYFLPPNSDTKNSKQWWQQRESRKDLRMQQDTQTHDTTHVDLFQKLTAQKFFSLPPKKAKTVTCVCVVNKTVCDSLMRPRNNKRTSDWRKSDISPVKGKKGTDVPEEKKTRTQADGRARTWERDWREERILLRSSRRMRGGRTEKGVKAWVERNGGHETKQQHWIHTRLWSMFARRRRRRQDLLPSPVML